MVLGDTSTAHLSVLNKAASASILSSDNSKDSTEQEHQVHKFAILMHHFDDYVINTDSRLTGDSYSTVKQLETLGYNVISINPNRWQGMAISSSEEKSLFLLQQLELANCDNTLKQNFSCKDIS